MTPKPTTEELEADPVLWAAWALWRAWLRELEQGNDPAPRLEAPVLAARVGALFRVLEERYPGGP